ncbi:MAG: hypothetical protein NTW87_06175 [Planctomycetota bacterium]|nr:hypothetical protein [Planctomycetota bacterium]
MIPPSTSRLWWYAFDQDGEESQTIAVFNCKDWQRAVEIGREKAKALVADAQKQRQQSENIR